MGDWNPPLTNDIARGIATMRLRGVGRPLTRSADGSIPSALDPVISLARTVAQNPRLPSHTLIAQAVSRAVPRIGPPEYVEAAAVLLWLDLPHHEPPDARAVLPPPTLGRRRKDAADLMGYRASYFARHLEQPLLEHVAEQLIALVEEHHPQDGLPAIPGVLQTLDEHVSVHHRADEWFTRQQQRAQDVRRAREILGMARSDLFSFRVGTHHPLYVRGAPHPDDRAALISVSGESIERARARQSLKVVPDLPIDLALGMVLIGSPEAEAVTRLAFGYERKTQGSGMFYHGGPIDLPYRWEEDREHVEALCSRFVPGKRRVERPNWPIIDNTGRYLQRRFPKLNSDGLLETDLLLITRVPNFLSRRGLESGRAIVSIGGAHGLATRAIALVLQDVRLLTQLAEHLRPGDDGFQALIEVSGVVHDPIKGSRASHAELVDLQMICRSDVSWDDAERTVRRRLLPWRNEVSP